MLGFVPPEVAQARERICDGCPFLMKGPTATGLLDRLASGLFGQDNSKRCAVCRCFIVAKTKLRSERCPNGAW